MTTLRTSGLVALALASQFVLPAEAQNSRQQEPNGAPLPSVRVRLPERFRLLNGQLFDLRVEAINADPAASLQVLIDGNDVTSTLPGPEVSTDNDADSATPDKAWVYRALSFATPGVHTIVTRVTSGGQTGIFTQRVGVQDFNPGAIARKNIILYIGDAMGTAYRDAGRIVAKSTGNRFREGFFDELQNMDTMAASGMVMTYNSERVVPDSSPTASAWSTGNKTGDGTHGVFADNNDFRFSTANVQGTKQFALDNPRVETLWEYLRRLHGYKTGIVSTADITDATPGGEGSHVLSRALTFDIARQFVDGSFVAGNAFDVILGGGREHFDKRNATNSGDTRNLITELTSTGWTYTATRTQLNAVRAGTPPAKLVGLFFSSVASADGGLTTGAGNPANTGANGNMTVAYDKLGLIRSADEPVANFNGYVDQPFLDEMTDAAIRTLSKDGAPFILMVEGASIDKQSHPNHASGVIWDVIEFDKAIGVGRAFSAADQAGRNTLIVVTADHDQSMHILGVTDSSNLNAVLNTRSNSVYPRTITPYDPRIGAGTAAPGNGGNNVGEVVGFPDYAEQNFAPGGVAPVSPNYPNNTNRFRLAVGFRTGNHTGSAVPITADGPGALLFTGYFDQTDIFFKMARVLSTDTTALDEYRKLINRRFSTISPNY
ncbi:MAG: alkaline phosphatase [Verrucomicrobia bacterium]|nr:alkaline phosphatase [Verrucomicrobiota bacterium]